MFPGELEISDALENNPLMRRPSATQALGSAYAVTLYVKAAYRSVCYLGSGDLETLTATLSGLQGTEVTTTSLVTAAA